MKNKNIIKVYSWKIFTIYTSISLLLILCYFLVIKFWGYYDFIKGVSVTFIIIIFILYFIFPVYIQIGNLKKENKKIIPNLGKEIYLKINDQTNFIYLNHRSFKRYGINTNDVDYKELDGITNVDLVVLDKKTAIQNGQKRWGSKYLFFDGLSAEKNKYIYISFFTQKQINLIINIIQEKYIKNNNFH